MVPPMYRLTRFLYGVATALPAINNAYRMPGRRRRSALQRAGALQHFNNIYYAEQQPFLFCFYITRAKSMLWCQQHDHGVRLATNL